MRILEAYREDCNLVWSDNTAGIKSSNEFCNLMNDLQKKRVKELDKAVSKLKQLSNQDKEDK